MISLAESILGLQRVSSFSPCLLLPLERVVESWEEGDRRATETDSSLVLKVKEHKESLWLTIDLVIIREEYLRFGDKTCLASN